MLYSRAPRRESFCCEPYTSARDSLLAAVLIRRSIPYLASSIHFLFLFFLECFGRWKSADSWRRSDYYHSVVIP